MTATGPLDEAFVLSIYDAVADQALWPGVLDGFAERVGAFGCIVFEWTLDLEDRRLSAPLWSSAYSTEGIDRYIETHFVHEAEDQDAFEAKSLIGDAIDLVQDDVIAGDIADLAQRPNVQTLQKLGIHHRAACLLNKDNTSISRFSVQFPVGRGRMTEQERAFAASTLPHVAKALDLSRPAQNLARQHAGMLAAMDRLSVGVCVLDAKGRVVTQNEEFRRQEDRYRVFRTTRGGMFELVPPDTQARFHDLQTEVAHHGHFGARPRKEAIATDENTYLCIEVVPLTRSAEVGTKALDGSLLFSIDTSRPISWNPLPMQSAYGLTETELLLVRAIGDGLTNAEIADRRDRSVLTVNSQIKSILQKTDCANRTQLVRLMTSFGLDYITETSAPPGDRV